MSAPRSSSSSTVPTPRGLTEDDDEDARAALASAPMQHPPRRPYPSQVVYCMVDAEMNGPNPNVHGLLELSLLWFALEEGGRVRILDWVDVRLYTARPSHPATDAFWGHADRAAVRAWLSEQTLPLGPAAALVTHIITVMESKFHVRWVSAPACVDKAWITGFLWRGAVAWSKYASHHHALVSPRVIAGLAHAMGTVHPWTCLTTMSTMAQRMCRWSYGTFDRYRSHVRDTSGVATTHRAIEDCVAQAVDFAWIDRIMRYEEHSVLVQWACDVPPTLRRTHHAVSGAMGGGEEGVHGKHVQGSVVGDGSESGLRTHGNGCGGESGGESGHGTRWCAHLRKDAVRQKLTHMHRTWATVTATSSSSSSTKHGGAGGGGGGGASVRALKDSGE
jgi:hypothetical protein